jgi:hypothetical protein
VVDDLRFGDYVTLVSHQKSRALEIKIINLIKSISLISLINLGLMMAVRGI